ncbi:14457_t:CDS:2 [Entrophospora sp. SA101]|nr:14457_t:CDS:2 [Entrophospora sp. SA101]
MNQLQQNEQQSLPTSTAADTSSIGVLSAQRIQDLEKIEKMIVELLNVAAQAIMCLASDGHVNKDTIEESKHRKLSENEQIQMFEDLTKNFGELIDKIQIGLRVQFRHMRNMGITAGDIPFRTVTYGEEKEYETWLNAAKILRKELENLVDIGVAAGDLSDIKNETFRNEVALV